LAVELAPITSAHVPAVAQFLHASMNPRVSEASWSRALDVPWSVSSPNHGYFLGEGRSVVGAYLAYYSDRTIAGNAERFCNLGAWCVLEDHRFQGLGLLTSLLAQQGYHFTDFSASGNVIALNRRLKFSDLDTTTAVLPNAPWPALRGRCHISSDPDVLSATLSGPDLQIYRDHRETAAARHVVLTSGAESCYVVFRRDFRKPKRVFASVLHVGNQEMFRRLASRLGTYLLMRHGAAATLVELRVAGGRPAGSFVISRSPRPKMFKSPSLDADQIDYLYSELTCLEW
jgi:hypothetical protein